MSSRHGQRTLLFSTALVVALVILSDAMSPANAARVPGPGSTRGVFHNEGAAGQQAPRLHVMVELKRPPAAHVFSAQQRVNAASQDQIAAATQRQLATIQDQQTTASTQLARLGAVEVYRLQRVYNGIAIVVDAAQIDAILSLPYVAGVHSMAPKTPDHHRSIPYVGAPAIWGGLAGFPANGEEMTIAIIDTGLDYQHLNFGGSREYANNDPTQIGDVSDFPGAKVIAGYDFAGDAYNADVDSVTYNPFPAPDPDPMDCHGHGTHVAGTAAGQGVTLNPSLAGYPGPFDADTFERAFEIGPGMAPAAKLVALKIFGCQGSSDLTELAIEWAVDPNGDGDFSDRVDVINMSIGSPYGSASDPTAIASDNAALIGVIVVASAGNMGDVTYVAGAPAIAGRAISVAAANDHLSTSAQQAGLTTENTASSFSSSGPRRGDHGLKPDISAPGEFILSARAGIPGTAGTRFSGTSMAAPHVAGAMALLRQVYPDWRVEELKALVMNTARLQGQALPQPEEATKIGSGMLDLENSLNTEVIAYSGDDPGEVGISFGAPAVIDRHVDVKNLRLHNRGDRDVDYAVTFVSSADIPGVDFSVENDEITVPANGYASVPALMTAVGAEMRHTPGPTDSTPQSLPSHWLSEESGYLMLWPKDGGFTSVLTLDGVQDRDLGMDASATFTYTPGTGILDYALMLPDFSPAQIDAIEIRHGLPGMDEGVAHRLPVPSDLNGTVTLTSGAVVLNPLHEPLLASGALHLRVVTSGEEVEEIRGQIVPQPAVLHVPVYAAPRPVSDMRAVEPTLTISSGRQIPLSLNLFGHDLVAEKPPLDYASLVSAFELHHSSLNSSPGGNDGGIVDVTDHADLQYVGVTDNLNAVPGGAVDQSTVYIGIATYADWSTPNEVEFDIFIDADEDGQEDLRLFNSDARGYSSKDLTSDAFVTAIENLRTEETSISLRLNGLSPLSIDTALFNTNVMILPVAATDIGLSGENADFNYRIESNSNESIVPVETTPMLRYDLNAGVIDLIGARTEAPIFDDLDGGRIDLRVNGQNYLAAGDRDLLLFHHQNGSGNRVEIVDVQFEWRFQQFLPIITVQ